MCSQFWTITTEYECPLCGSHEHGELQTHFMGDFGSCSNFYALGESVDELRGVEAGRLGEGLADDFISVCRNCRGVIDWGARIENSAVVEVWAYRWQPARPPGSLPETATPPS